MGVEMGKEPPYTAGGNINYAATMEILKKAPHETKNRTVGSGHLRQMSEYPIPLKALLFLHPEREL
jgi:hypothetical protein